jgi:8-oxo-dGTP pyrophosphatase MutT (NUDIX family)
LTTAFDRIDLEGPPQQASARELAEELGIRVLPQAVFHPTDGESK